MNGMHTYSVNSSRLRVYIFIGLLCVFLTPIFNNLLEHFSLLSKLQPWVSAGPSFAGTYAIVFSLYNKFGWKLQWLQYFGLSSVRNLNGTYKGELLSSYNKDTKIPLELSITQTWSKIVVYMKTGNDTSESYSYMASIFEIDGKSSRLAYSFTNKPFNAIADSDMQPHDGTANIAFHNNGKAMGTYFNGRQRAGSIKLQKVDSSG